MQLPSDLSLAGLQQALLHMPELAALPVLERRLLLCHVLGLTRIELITRDTRLISASESAQLAAVFTRRLHGEPIAYIVGRREFFGLDFIVTPDVLIPRPETELLVELAMHHAPLHSKVADLGTGSGAIAVTLAHQRPDLALWALDLSEGALQVAQQNAQAHLAPEQQPQFVCSDWYQALPDTLQFDLIVANPPYIEQHDAHLRQGDLRFEPLSALTDHGDGLQALHKIIDGAPQHLRSGGYLLMEHGYDQAGQVRAMLTQQGWQEVQSWRDLAGIERVSGARRS